MSVSPPTKPPRGVKQGRETSGLLMSVIRTLSASETNEQREKEKAKLEKDYKKSDQRLDELVAARSNDLTTVMQLFSTACSSVNTSRARLRAARARLIACRGLLKVRRDDLRRLWMDARKHKYTLDLLNQIDQLVGVDKDVSKHLEQGHYLNAACVLQSALDTASTSLSQVDALQHLRIELENKKQQLVDRTWNTMRETLYRDDINSVLNRQGSTRDRCHNLTLNKVLAEVNKTDRVCEETLHEITTEYELSLTKEERTMKVNLTILSESIAVLKNVSQTIEKMRVQIQNELLDIISVISQQVLDFGVTQTYPMSTAITNDTGDPDDLQTHDGQHQLLVELLTTLLDTFKIVASRQKLMLEIWKHTLAKHKINDVKLYSMQHYWNSVQAVLQLLITDYLDLRNLTNRTQQTSYVEQTINTDISTYFLKKKPQGKKKVRLFKFSSSEASELKAQSGNTIMDAVDNSGKAYTLVCRATPDNLVHIYPILESFMNEIENNVSGVCSLRSWLESHARGPEAERLATVFTETINQLIRSSAAFREAVNRDTIVVYSVCVKAWQCCSRACIRAARVRTNINVGGISVILSSARQALVAQSQGRAAKWLTDDDIARFLRELPNWRHYKREKNCSNDELNQSYEREAEILGTSLGDGIIQSKEIISNTNNIRDIAIMCESMDWLRNRISTIPSLYTSVNNNMKLSDRLHKEINTLATQFEELSDYCLLLLHLELRIQCFHYLCGGASSDSETGGKLASTLRSAHHIIHDVLTTSRLQYVMNGLGEMISCGIVWACRSGGPGGGVNKGGLSSLAHCLAAMGVSANALHRAHSYMRMLTLQPEEILKTVEDKGPEFSELEYLNAFNIIAKNKNYTDAEMKVYLNKLSNILGHVGVTV